MRQVSVTEAKNGLSGLLAEVGRGEVVLIMHRGTPVARIEPYRTSELDDDAAVADLIGRGIADPPESPCELDELAAMPSPRLPDGVSASRLIAAERADER